MTEKIEKKQCKAKSKQSGERCKNWAVPGYDVCHYHGAGGRPKKMPKKPKTAHAPKGNRNAAKHGAYSPRLLPEEQPIYETYLDEYLKDVPNPSVTDRRALERLAVLETKWQTAVTKGAPPDALDILHRLLHRELKALQVTRESKDTSLSTGNSPAEVVAALFMKAQRLGMESDTVQALPDPEVIDVDVVEVKSESEKDGGK